MKPEPGATSETYGVEQGHCYRFSHSAPLVQFAFNGYHCLVPLSRGEQVELAEDGYLLKPLLCIPDNAKTLQNWTEGHVHRTLFTVR